VLASVKLLGDSRESGGGNKRGRGVGKAAQWRPSANARAVYAGEGDSHGKNRAEFT